IGWWSRYIYVANSVDTANVELYTLLDVPLACTSTRRRLCAASPQYASFALAHLHPVVRAGRARLRPGAYASVRALRRGQPGAVFRQGGARRAAVVRRALGWRPELGLRAVRALRAFWRHLLGAARHHRAVD